MNTLKTNLHGICKDIAEKFPEWKFVSGKFKNSSLMHTDFIVDPGFSFDRGFGHLQPSVVVNNKRSEKLAKILIGEAMPSSIVNFQVIAHLLMFMPEPLRLSCLICENKASYLATVRESNRFDENAIKIVENQSIDINEARSVLEAMMRDGISFIDAYYDVTDEDRLLKALPPKYTTRNKIPYDEMERQKGVMMCIIHMTYGDFDFIEQYCRDEFKTIYPKRISDLEKLLAALPNLKQRYFENGSVI